MLSLCFPLCTEWTNAKDLNKLAAVNGALESVQADGTLTAHIQVMLIQSLNTFFLISHMLLFHWFADLGVRGLLHNLSFGGCKENKLLLHMSSGAYLNHPSQKSIHCEFTLKLTTKVND